MQSKRIEQIIEESEDALLWRAIGLSELRERAEWAAEEFEHSTDPALKRVSELSSELLALDLRL